MTLKTLTIVKTNLRQSCVYNYIHLSHNLIAKNPRRVDLLRGTVGKMLASPFGYFFHSDASFCFFPCGREIQDYLYLFSNVEKWLEMVISRITDGEGRLQQPFPLLPLLVFLYISSQQRTIHTRICDGKYYQRSSGRYNKAVTQEQMKAELVVQIRMKVPVSSVRRGTCQRGRGISEIMQQTL